MNCDRIDHIETAAQAAKTGARRAGDNLLRVLDPDLQRFAQQAAATSRAEVDDLTQEARLATLDLLGSWRPEKGPFSAYLFGVLPARLRDSDQGGSIRLPANVAGALRVLRASQADDQEVDRADLCRRWSISEAQLRAADEVDRDPEAAFLHASHVAEASALPRLGTVADVLNDADASLVLAVASDGIEAVATTAGIHLRTARRRFEAALARAEMALAA